MKEEAKPLHEHYAGASAKDFNSLRMSMPTRRTGIAPTDSMQHMFNSPEPPQKVEIKPYRSEVTDKLYGTQEGETKLNTQRFLRSSI